MCAKIPQYETQIQPQSVQNPQLDSSLFTSAAEGGTEVMQTVAAITDQMYKIETVKQKTKAETDMKIELAQIEAEFDNDTDTSDENLQRYQQKIKEVKGKHLSQIKDAPTRFQANQEFDIATYNTSSKIASGFNERRLAESEYQFNKSMILAGNTYKKITDKTQKKILRDSMLQVIEEHRISKVLSNDEAITARKTVDSWEKDWQAYQIQSLLNSENPELVEDAIIAGQFGELTPDEKSNWLGLADRAKAKLDAEVKAEFEKQKSAKEDYFQEKLFKGELKINDLEKELEVPEDKGGASRSLLNTMKNNLYSSTKKTTEQIAKSGPDKTRAREFIKATDKALDSDLDIIRARQILIDANSDGVVTDQEALVLDNIIKLSKEYTSSAQSNPFINNWRKIKAIAGKYDRDPSLVEKDLRKYLDAHTKSKDSNKIAQDIIEENKQKRYPEFIGLEVGQPYTADFGTVNIKGFDDDGMPIVEYLNAR